MKNPVILFMNQGLIWEVIMIKYDVTMLINEEMQVYKNKESKKPIFEVAASQEMGDSTNETLVTLNVHTGTHVDFPRHIYKDGKTSKDFDITTFIREVKVLDFTHLSSKIGVNNLKLHDIKENDFLLFKTRNSDIDAFIFDFVYLDKDAATYLADLKISGVGIDALGIEREQSGHPSHKALMAQGIFIIEGLRLKEVSEGTYKMIALPLKLDDVDALPLSVVLIKE